jgi:adenylate cyclase
MAEKRAHRRLAAILAADVVGYSHLMEQDEAGTLAALKARRHDVLVPLVTGHNGRVVNFTGDGVLVEFGSAVDAVQCAIELQKGFTGANQSVPESRRVIIRVGINLGDVIVEGSEIYGDGVNVAARLEGLAEPGGIYISATVHDHVVGKLAQPFVDLGEYNLKNIAKAVRVYRVEMDGSSERGLRPTLTVPDKPSIAVLPFANMSGDPAQQYFSDGITEDIITELSRFRSIFVIARNSTFQYRDKADDVRRIARELAAHFIVEGSVRKVGTRIRVTAQLIEAAGGTHIWADRYDRPAEDIFAIQDEVVGTIAATVAGRLEATSAEILRRRPTASLSAYECILRGTALPIGDPDNEAAAHQLFEQAVALDPEYSLACAKLAISYAKRWLDSMDGSTADLDRAFELATSAIALDAQEGVCQTAMSFIQQCRNRYAEAEVHARRALALNPNRPNALVTMADFLTLAGRPDEAVPFIIDAMRLDTNHPAWYWTNLGVAHFVARRDAEAIIAIRHRSNLSFYCQAYLAASHARLGEVAAMRVAAAEIMRLRPDFTVTGFVSKESYQNAADREHLAENLRKAGLPE